MTLSGGLNDDEEEVENILAGDSPIQADPADETATIKSESTEEELESGKGLLTGAQYEVPESKDAFVDTKDGKIVDKKDLTPFQIIKSIAAQNNIKIKEPRKNCCYCYERGYESIDSKTQMPIPCRCLFRGKTAKEKESENYFESQKLPRKVNHEQRRRIAKALLKQVQSENKIAKNRKKAENLPKEPESEDKQNEYINKVLKQYIKLNSLKKTSKVMSLTLTETKKIIKKNKEKLEKMKNKS